MAIIFITGTSRGLGRFLRRHLSSAGHEVFGNGRQPTPGDSHHLAFDVRDEDACRQAVRELIGRVGQLDVLINNAGSHLLGAATETTATELDDQLALNFRGPVNLMRAVLPHFLERRAGRIINMSSVGGRLATPFTSAYAASKFALEGYTEALRLELLPFGVYVSNLEPGFLATGTHDRSVVSVEGVDPTFHTARARALERLRADGERGTSLDVVARTIDRLLQQRVPPFRCSVDGFLTRLELLRDLTPPPLFERLVLKQTAPGLGPDSSRIS